MLNDWFVMICLGILFFFVGTIILSILLSVDPRAPMTITAEPVGFILITVMAIVFLDLGPVCVISGWKNRHKASSISLGTDSLGRRQNFMSVDNPLGLATDGAPVTDEAKVVKSVSDGMSLMFKAYLWAQRIGGAIAVILVFLFTAGWWAITILDFLANHKTLNIEILIPIGLAFLCYIAIIYIMLLRKPAPKTV